MKIMLEKDAKMPTRSHYWDAGLDLYSRETQWIPAKESAIFDTGVHIALCPGTVGMIKSRSGLNVKHGLVCEGVVDCGFSGSIRIKIHNLSGYDYKVETGDRIAQLVILPILMPELELVDRLEETERGEKGFGSSGK